MIRPASVLLLHGITRRGDDFDALRDLLPLPSAAPDLLGHGTAPRAPDYRLIDYADALPPPENAPHVLYGHSLGGLIALLYAAKYPGQTRAVVLEDPPLFEIAPERFAANGSAAAFEALAQQIETSQPEDLLSDMGTWPSGAGDRTLGDALDHEALARRAAALSQTDPAALRVPGTDAFLEGTDLGRALGQITCPVHLIAGNPALGSVLTHADRETFLSQAQNPTLHVFDALGHDIHSFAGQDCARIVRHAAG
ncbi:MAG: alpha/beta hydrolase [Pseudomonadota bacterium]